MQLQGSVLLQSEDDTGIASPLEVEGCGTDGDTGKREHMELSNLFLSAPLLGNWTLSLFPLLVKSSS